MLKSFLALKGLRGLITGAGGGGGDTTPPVITNEAYDSGTDEWSADVAEDNPGSYWALWSLNATETNAAVKAAAIAVDPNTALGTYSFGPTIFTVSSVGLAVGTNYLHVLVEDAAGNAAQAVPQSLVVAAGYTERWVGYSAGDNWTQLDTAYNRDSSQLATAIQNDAVLGAPTLALRVGTSDGNYHYMTRDDITTYLAARTTSQRVNFLVKLRFVSTSTSQRAGIGYQGAAAKNTGFRIVRSGANNNAITMQKVDDIQTSAGGSEQIVLGTGLTDLALYWCRGEVQNTTFKARIWLDGAGEPGTWGGTLTHGSDLVFANFGIVGRVSSPGMDVLGYSIAIDADAASF